MAKFLCITLNPAIDITLELDRLTVGQVNRVQHSNQRPAGKGLNVAQVLRGLGHEIWVTGFLGQDNRAMFEADFLAQGFHNHFVTVAGQTRQNIKIAETQANGRMTDINGKGFHVTPADISRLLEKCATLAKAVDYVVLAGSLPQAFSLDDFKNLIQTLQQPNPKLAPKLAIDTSGEALKIAFAEQPFLLKPNDDELTECFGLPAKTYTEQMAVLQKIALRSEHLLISLGSKGVNWLMLPSDPHNAQDLHATPPTVRVKSTVGAGDTLLAGVLHGLAIGLSAEKTLTLATALASHTVSQVGCELPDDKQLDRLKNDVVIEKLVS